MTIDASKLEGWASALQVAKNGLGWYRNEFPETYSASDDKAHARLDEALASMAEELEVARGEVMVNGLTEAETSASASVAGLTLKAPAGWSISRSSDGEVITSASPDGVRWSVIKGEDMDARRMRIGAHFHQLLSDMLDAHRDVGPEVCGVSCSSPTHCGDTQAHASDVAAASADDMKVYDGIAAGYHRSTASAIDPKKMRGPCGMATSQHEGRRRITLEFDMPEDAVEAHSALSDMGWSHRSIRSEQIPSGLGQDVDPEIVNQIAAQAGFGPAAAWPEFSSLMQRFFNIAFKMGVQSATQGGGL